MITTIEVHGKIFNVEKRDKEWQTNYRDAKATTGATKVEAVQLLKEYDRDKILKACDYHDKVVTRDTYVKEHIEEFTRSPSSSVYGGLD